MPLRHSQKPSEYNKGQLHRRLRHQIHSGIYARVLGRLSTSSALCRVGNQERWREATLTSRPVARRAYPTELDPMTDTKRDAPASPEKRATIPALSPSRDGSP